MISGKTIFTLMSVMFNKIYKSNKKIIRNKRSFKSNMSEALFLRYKYISLNIKPFKNWFGQTFAEYIHYELMSNLCELKWTPFLQLSKICRIKLIPTISPFILRTWGTDSKFLLRLEKLFPFFLSLSKKNLYYKNLYENFLNFCQGFLKNFIKNNTAKNLWISFT